VYKRQVHDCYPMDARLKDINYDAPILLNFDEIYKDGEKTDTKSHYKIMIGRMPIMLKSSVCNLSKLNSEEKIEKGECPNDLGGYFIIKGKERVIVPQVRGNYNHVFVLKQKPNEKFKYIAEVRSMSNETGHSVLIQALYGNDDRSILFSLPHVKEQIPVGVVFKAMGFVTDEEIQNLIGLDDALLNPVIKFIIRDSFFCTTQQEALKYIGERAMHILENDEEEDYAWQVVENESLPHLGISGSIKEQALFMGNIVKKLLQTAVGYRTEDDRDNYANKRIETTGTLIHDIFRNLFKKFIKSLEKMLKDRKQKPDILSIIARNRTSITKGLHQCMATGNWGIQKTGAYIRHGVSQVLDRMTFYSSLSHLRRVIIPVGKESKNSAMRQMHSSSFGMLCPCECFHPDTKILTWSGEIKKAKDIIVGDVLIDDKGNPTKVKSTCSGLKEMYTIKHNSLYFEDYTVTDNHILVLKKENEVIDVSIDEYLKFKNKKEWKTFKGPGKQFEINECNFTLEKQPLQPFVGWQLEGNGRFLLGDFTVTHNTPEGAGVGIVLNLALSCKITRRIPVVIVKKVLEKLDCIVPVNDFDISNTYLHTPVFLNGAIIGYCEDYSHTLQELKKLKSQGLLDSEISITYDVVDNDIRMYCDDGRVSRPLLTLTDNTLNLAKQEKYNWKNLLKNGIVEYLDSSEIENVVIAMNMDRLKVQTNDYMEIHPILMLGIMASRIPFPDHSQSPRNCYQSSMGKQALGYPLLSYNIRADTTLHVLQYAQKPLVYTKIDQLLKSEEMPCGMNAMVAILAYTGYNQEDSCILNRSSVERGMFCLTSYYTIDTIEKKKDSNTMEEICMPPESTPHLKEGDPGYFLRKKEVNYSLLDENGIVRPRQFYDPKKKIFYGPETVVKKGDVIVGKKLVTKNKNGQETIMDVSVVVQPDQEGIVDKVYVNITPSGTKLVKIVIREWRVPGLGDKFAARSSQKATVGMVFREEDLPFTQEGIRPDIIINPCCIPGRMTINQLIECILGKKCCKEGTYGDATPFTTNSEDIAKRLVGELSKYGFESHGWETMINGMTGEMMNAQIFMGPTFYQRLKHMVDDKMHARAKGQVTILVRQPTEGRSKEGGLRFGEMEKDGTNGHGTASFLLDRLFYNSDPFKIPLCRKCGIMTNATNECQKCKGDKVVMTNIPYASKLLTTELTALNLGIQIFPQDK
jgi:DNA-directed RNA polymerase beta subunit